MKCKICGYNAPHIGALSRHMKEHKNDVQEAEEEIQEAVPLEAEPEQPEIGGASNSELFNIEEGNYIRLSRKNPPDGFIDKFYTDLDLAAIKSKYGGGVYLIELCNGKNQYQKSRTVKIAGPPKQITNEEEIEDEPAEETVSDDREAKREERQLRNLERTVNCITKLATARAIEKFGIAGTEPKQGDDKMFALLTTVLTAQLGKRSPIEDALLQKSINANPMKDALQTAELIENLRGNKDSTGKTFFDVIDKVADKALPVLDNAINARRDIEHSRTEAIRMRQNPPPKAQPQPAPAQVEQTAPKTFMETIAASLENADIAQLHMAISLNADITRDAKIKAVLDGLNDAQIKEITSLDGMAFVKYYEARKDEKGVQLYKLINNAPAVEWIDGTLDKIEGYLISKGRIKEDDVNGQADKPEVSVGSAEPVSGTQG